MELSINKQICNDVSVVFSNSVSHEKNCGKKSPTVLTTASRKTKDRTGVDNSHDIMTTAIDYIS